MSGHRRRPPRGLRAEEEALWRRVAETAQPLAGRPLPAALRPRPTAAPPADPPPPPVPAAPEAGFRITPFRIGALRDSTAAPQPGPVRAPAPAMDARAYRRLTRGKLAPEARIDLHGMTLAQAQPALTAFLRGAQGRGVRLALVITGKGRGSAAEGPLPYRPGALRHEVPIWLQRAPLAALVQQVARAHPRHGGDGALYVYLRRIGPGRADDV
ncbi:MAG: Smr/MutS family protein [Alkalilacustris sp.]